MKETKILKTLSLKSGDELVLRTAVTGDAQKIIEYLNVIGGETDNLQFGADQFNISLEKEQQIIDSINQDQNRLMILGLIGNNIIALAQLNCAGRTWIKHNSEISISVSEKYGAPSCFNHPFLG